MRRTVSLRPSECWQPPRRSCVPVASPVRRSPRCARSARQRWMGRCRAGGPLSRLSDEALIERLTSIRGIGRWTVEMLLIFTLGRQDVLPVDDFGVRDGYRVLYGLEIGTETQSAGADRAGLVAVSVDRGVVSVARVRRGQARETAELAGVGGNRDCDQSVRARSIRQGTLPISAPQCLHLLAAGFRSSERHAGQVLVGGGSPNTSSASPRHDKLVRGDDQEIHHRHVDDEVDDRGDKRAEIEICAVGPAGDKLPTEPGPLHLALGGSDQRVDDIVGECLHKVAERKSNDQTDRDDDDIAAHQKVSETPQHVAASGSRKSDLSRTSACTRAPSG